MRPPVADRAPTASLLEVFRFITIAMYWSWEVGLREQPPRPLQPGAREDRWEAPHCGSAATSPPVPGHPLQGPALAARTPAVSQ